jgi:uncharacterized BrkB/YihY/UPF0761 family membrane protein
MKSLKATWQLIKQTLSSWSDDKGARMGAALSYYTAFSLALGIGDSLEQIGT